MAEKYFGHAPRELRAAAVARYLTTDLTLQEVGEQFGTHKTNIHNWVKAAAGSQALKKSKPPSAMTFGYPDSSREAALAARSIEASGGKAPREQAAELLEVAYH